MAWMPGLLSVNIRPRQSSGTRPTRSSVQAPKTSARCRLPQAGQQRRDEHQARQQRAAQADQQQPPMLAVPGWADSASEPNAVPVVSAENTMARAVAEPSSAVRPARQFITK